MTLTPEDNLTISGHIQIISQLASVLTAEEGIPIENRLLSTETVASLNKTIQDSSDAIDAITTTSQAQT